MKALIILGLFVLVLVSGCLLEVPSSCPTNGVVVYDSGNPISTKEEAQQVFLEYNPEANLNDMTYGTKESLYDGEVEGWISGNLPITLIEKNGKVYRFDPCF